MTYAEIKELLQAKRDMIIAGLIIAAVLLAIAIGMRMQQNYLVRQQSDEERLRAPEKVRLGSSTMSATEGEQPRQKPATLFFLKPSPDEVLALIKESGNSALPASNQKYTGLKVMWPAYFFQILKEESGQVSLLLDVSEDGFGVTIRTEVDTSRFPEVLSLERGTKIWLAGELMGVDAAGTGTIYLLTEEVRFEDDLIQAVGGTPTAQDSEQQLLPLEGSTKAEEEKQ
jgi:hypothetical protein